jgi:hypothetical protein
MARYLRDSLFFAIGLMVPALMLTQFSNPETSPYMDREGAIAYVRFYVILGALVSASVFSVALARGRVNAGWPGAFGAGATTCLVYVGLLLVVPSVAGSWLSGVKGLFALSAFFGVPYLAGWVLTRRLAASDAKQSA